MSVNEALIAIAEAETAGNYDSLSEQLELESIRYSRALPEEGEARVR